MKLSNIVKSLLLGTSICFLSVNFNCSYAAQDKGKQTVQTQKKVKKNNSAKKTNKSKTTKSTKKSKTSKKSNSSKAAKSNRTKSSSTAKKASKSNNNYYKTPIAKGSQLLNLQLYSSV